MDSPAASPEATPPTPVPAAPAPAATAATALAPSLARRLAPIALVAALGGGDAWLFQRDVVLRDQLGSARAAADSAERKVEDAAGQIRGDREELARARKERERLEAELDVAKRGGSDERVRLEAEKGALAKKLAELADRLGESEAARTAAEAHSRDLDQVMEALKRRRINARRLAGLEAPPKVVAELVSQDDHRVPPLLVLRVRDSLAGLEEGDVLYLARTGEDGAERETGRVVLERVDGERRLLQARVQRLDAGEKLSIGDKLTTTPPGK